MRTLPIEQMISIARQHAAARRFAEAEGICHTLLKDQPDHALALWILGNCAAGRERHAAAVSLLQRAAETRPRDAALAIDLGHAATGGAQWSTAIEAFARAAESAPLPPEALRQLARCHMGQENPNAAIPLYRTLLDLAKHDSLLHADLGGAYRAAGDHVSAITALENAIGHGDDRATTLIALALSLESVDDLSEAAWRLDAAIRRAPADAPAHFHRGRIHLRADEIAPAIAALRTCVALDPRHIEAYGILGTCLLETANIDEALGCFAIASALEAGTVPGGDLLSELGKLDQRIATLREKLAATPHDPTLLYQLATALRMKHLPDEAAETYQRLLAVDPENLLALNNLGMIYKDQGDIPAALAHFQLASERLPAEDAFLGNLAYTMLFSAAHSSAQIGRTARDWARRFAAPLHRQLGFSAVDRASERRLRIGYVSPDFRLHPVGRLAIPWFEKHRHDQFEVFCYYNGRTNDAVNKRFRAAADHWCDVELMTDAQLVTRINDDRIDILIDLTMHMAGNRLRMFARKPAPLQITYLAYAGTTGLRAIDYRLSDPVIDPPERDESVYTERTFRLPTTYWCYEPSDAALNVNPLPAQRRGFITFGSFNNFCKVSHETLALWRDILRRVPRSRLLLHTCAGNHRKRVLAFFAEAGIAADRVSFFDRIRLAFFYQLHHTVDIALDPFPYAGGTTTLDSLWMGIPTITLVGETAVARGGLTILRQLGLEEWAAHSQEAYVEAAIGLANDWPRLAEHRRTLRDRMRASPLMDTQRFAGEIEAAYRTMWRQFCLDNAPPAPLT